ncbi:MAG: hypothetical protein ACTHLZ_05280 [Tepidisphaeraceae bacterium]
MPVQRKRTTGFDAGIGAIWALSSFLIHKGFFIRLGEYTRVKKSSATRGAAMGEPASVGLQVGDFVEATIQRFEQRRVEFPLGWEQAVVHPLQISPGGDEPRPAEIREMSRDLGLGQIEHAHEISHANFLTGRQQAEDAQASAIGQGPVG